MKKQETASFKGLLPQHIELSLIVSSQLIYGLVHEGHDVEAVEDYIHLGQSLTDCREIGAAHVHSNSFEFSRSPGQGFQKGPDVLFALSFDRMQDSAARQIGHHCHILMAIFEAELIDPDGLHLMKGDFAIQKLQPFLMDVFDKIPPNSQILGDRPDRAEPKHFEHCQSKGSNIAVSPYHKGKRRLLERRAAPALQTGENQLQHALLAPYGTHEEPPAFLTFEARIPAAALRSPDPLIVHRGTENDPIGHKMGRCVWTSG